MRGKAVGSLSRQCRPVLTRPWAGWGCRRHCRASLVLPALRAIDGGHGAAGARGFRSACCSLERNVYGRDVKGERRAAEIPVISEGQREVLSKIAFAFDIDGVLYQGSRGVPGAREILNKIQSHGIRYVFLTNGGGKHESAKEVSLAQRLGVEGGREYDEVIRNRVIQSHTPMMGWDDRSKAEDVILITGAYPESAREVALEYGFKKVITPADIIAANDKVYPFDNLKKSLHSKFAPLPDGKVIPNDIKPRDKNAPANTLKIDKIFVWNDPRDWSLDVQIIYDLLISHRGYMGTVSANNGDKSLPNNGWLQDGQPDLWISNLDLFWKTEYPVNRFGTGAFLDALKGVWAAATGGADLPYTALGKPLKPTYDYAQDRLLHHDHTQASGRNGEKKPLRRVYMIGDNPESDIRGANEYEPKDGSTEWVSILVRTGVWQETVAEPEPKYKPAVIVDDVVDAVGWALKNEGVEGVTREWLMKT